MQELESGQRAFATFRALNSEAEGDERDQLFRNMAQLFAYVSDRCEDDQVAEYDEILCQLADLVEIEARTHVAKILAPLERAPGSVVVKLANDLIAVAQPLLAFSNVLSDDDLIDIIAGRSEAHRTAIAGRAALPERVGEAIIEHGSADSVGALLRNSQAHLGQGTRERLLGRTRADQGFAAELRGRAGIDWESLRDEIDAASGKVLDVVGEADTPLSIELADRVNTVVFNRLRNQAGFSLQEWKLAFNQVKALADRRQLDERALARFVRFGYGHHAAAALSLRLQIGPEIFVKWLAGQDYSAVTVALRALHMEADLFEALIGILPWRDLTTREDKANIRARFCALSQDEAQDIFELWRAHAFRRRSPAQQDANPA